MPPLGTPAQIVVASCCILWMLASSLGLLRKRTGKAPPVESELPPILREKVSSWAIEIEGRFRKRSLDPWPTSSPLRWVVIVLRGGWVRYRGYARHPTPRFETRWGDYRVSERAFRSEFEPIGPGEI